VLVGEVREIFSPSVWEIGTTPFRHVVGNRRDSYRFSFGW
jgi:hypothetical protein